MTTQLMTAMGNSTGTPAGLAGSLANPVVKQLSNQIDTEISNHWSNSNDLKVSVTLDSGANGSAVQDRITFKMPPINVAASGVSMGNDWLPGGTIYLRYTSEKFKSGGRWEDSDSILVAPIVPSEAPGAQTTLYKIALNGDAAGGFKLANLNSATTEASLATACQNLRLFLSSFLIPDDALAARYAILKGSPYDLQPNLRDSSGCFDPGQTENLAAMNARYVFPDRSRQSSGPRNPARVMAPIIIPLLSQNPGLIQTIVATPVTKFYLVLGKNEADYLQGTAAITRLSQSALKLSCFQAPPSSDLSSIAALAEYNGTTTGALASFDTNGRLASIVLLSPADIASTTGVSLTTWLDPVPKWPNPNTPLCKSTPST
jgi:hypothetical protein